MKRVISASAGINGARFGPSYLLKKHGDLSFLIVFSTRTFTGNITGNFQNNWLITLFIVSINFNRSQKVPRKLKREVFGYS